MPGDRRPSCRRRSAARWPRAPSMSRARARAAGSARGSPGRSPGSPSPELGREQSRGRLAREPPHAALGGMDPLQERVEVEPALTDDDDLTVDDEPLEPQRAHGERLQRRVRGPYGQIEVGEAAGGLHRASVYEDRDGGSRRREVEERQIEERRSAGEPPRRNSVPASTLVNPRASATIRSRSTDGSRSLDRAMP